MSALAIPGNRELARLPEALQDGFAALLQALCKANRSAMITCSHTEELESVSRVLGRHLRQVSGIKLEILSASNSESLLQRFNERVAALPLDHARRDRSPNEGLTLWVVRLTSRLDWPEVNLLMSMVQGFPGTSVRLLLLCARDAVSDQTQALRTRWGSGLHHWDLTEAQRPSSKHVQPAVASLPTVTAIRRDRAKDAARRVWRVAQSVGSRILSLAPVQARWKWGLGCLMMLLGATTVAWWQTKPDTNASPNNPLRRPVPETVELLDDARAPSVIQGKRS